MPDIFVIDAFAGELFTGNPAAVVPLREWLPAPLMQQIAAENNLAETVFFVNRGEDYEIRWFTTSYEIDLCGHATLAAAFVIFTELGHGADQVQFFSALSGRLSASRNGNLITLDFPAWKPAAVEIPEPIHRALNLLPKEAFKTRDLILVYDHESEIRQLQPDLPLLRNLDTLLLIATAPGTATDYVCRVFDANDSISEDPVTGSAQSSLTPYWSERLQKNTLHARQLSKRGGDLFCSYQKETGRVLISGTCVKYMQGKLSHELFSRGA